LRPRLTGFLLCIAIVSALAWFGYAAWQQRRLVLRVGEVRQLAAEGHLQQALDAAKLLRDASPEAADAWLVSAEVMRALHERAAEGRMLDAAYALRPRAFAELPALVEQRLRGPDEPGKGFSTLAFLDQHQARFPDDRALADEARLVALTYLLGVTTLPVADRERVAAWADRVLAAWPLLGAATSGQRRVRASVLLALDRHDEATLEAKAGFAVDTSRWDAVALGWVVACEQLHRGEVGQARATTDAVLTLFSNWPGLHFGMAKPLVEFVQLTWRARTAERIAAPPGHAERLVALDRERARVQQGDPETRARIASLLAALDIGDDTEVRDEISELRALLSRDSGPTLEERVVRPDALVALETLAAQLAERTGDTEGASAAWKRALAYFPGDPWLASRATPP
jgi:tetratricopeptide (TPR) repeat protein